MNQAVLDRLKRKAEAHVMGQAMKLHSDVIDTLDTTGRGRQYGPHVASAPGDPPATDTGQLKNSVQFAKLGPLTWGVGVVGSPYPDGNATTAETAVYLEFGTRLMAARPFMRPALQKFKARRL